MKLNQFDIANLSSMICGDYPFKNKFPYRNTEKLAVFFKNIGLDYTYDKISQRKKWVESVLKDLNDKANPESGILSNELKTVIRGVLNPEDYGDLHYSDLEKAKKMMDKLLKQHNIRLNTIIDSENLNDKTSASGTHDRNSVSKGDDRFLKINPQVFKIPEKQIDTNLVSVMMPFSMEYQEVYDSIKLSCGDAGMVCQRADDIWENSDIIQDIFDLIYTSSIVVADFSTRNANVFYEIGIAHTLGKYVIPIAQNKNDVPFDLHHHRVLVYHNNSEGRKVMREKLISRIATIKGKFLTDKK
ncbi:MAG: hypothetical protein WC379_00730 [Methanoregula sp.]|jgi:hypothetical protein